MSKNATETILSEDGKRYVKKPVGSIYKGLNQYGAVSVKSCIRCGKHRNVKEMEGTKLAGKWYMKCAGGCK